MLKPNPIEIRMTDPAASGVSLDAVYRYGLVYHCNKVLGREQTRAQDNMVDLVIEYRSCPSCHVDVPMTQPRFVCGHQAPDRSLCEFQSESRRAVEYHITDIHTDHCPVCRCLIGSGVGGKGCQCPRSPLPFPDDVTQDNPLRGTP
jgi:hypothetical protein